MNKQLNWLLALLLVAMYSCSDETYDANRNDGMVNFTVKTSLPQGLKTYSSHNGGATNVDAASYNLRYIMEAWTKETPRRLAFRDYRIVDNNFTTTDVTFNARLLAMEYDFVFWADFVDQAVADSTAAAAGDLYYKTNNGATQAQIKANPATADPGLTAIAMQGTYKLSDDTRDAFYAVETVDLTTADQTLGTIELKRPFGKFRLIATDVIDGYLGEDVLSAKMQYTGITDLPGGFNALTGEVNNTTTVDVSAALTAAVSKETPKKIDGSDLLSPAQEVYVLGFDYIFAAPAQTVSFEVGAYKDVATTIQLGSNKTVSNIPIAENKLTTVIGSFFSHQGELTVIVSDIFDDEIVIDTQAKITIQETLDTYATLSDALTAAAPLGHTILVPAGVYNIGTGITIPAGVTVKGEGKDKTIFKVSNTTGGQTSVNLAGTLEDVWVMYNPNRLPGTAWNAENPAGVSMATGASLINSRVSGHRNGVYANNVTGITITGNDILKNRTGIQFANAVGATVSNNTISDNETIGVLLQYLSAAGADIPLFSGNTITGNWASDFENRWPTPYVVTLDGNTFSNGTKIVTVASGSGEGSSAANITKAGTTFKANVVTTLAPNIVLAGSVYQNTILLNGNAYATLAAAVTAAVAGETIQLTAGTFPITSTVTVNKAITIQGAAGLASKITTNDGTYVLLLTAGATIDGIFFEKSNKANQNLIGIQSNGVTIKNSKFVGQYVLGDTEVVRGIEGSPGFSYDITDNHFEALRQPGYLDGTGTITGNFVKGTRGFVLTASSTLTLSGNSFDANATDIAIIPSGVYANAYDDVITISSNNNGAKVDNQITVQKAQNGVLVANFTP